MQAITIDLDTMDLATVWNKGNSNIIYYNFYRHYYTFQETCEGFANSTAISEICQYCGNKDMIYLHLFPCQSCWVIYDILECLCLFCTLNSITTRVLQHIKAINCCDITSQHFSIILVILLFCSAITVSWCHGVINGYQPERSAGQNLKKKTVDLTSTYLAF